MTKKLWIVLLILTFVLGSLNIFWSKPAQANTGEERRVMRCTAEPWDDGGWNKVTPPPNSDQNPANSLTNPVQSVDKPELQKVRQKSERSLWFHFQLFLLNLRLLLGGK